ncbi:putative non-specific serine/threonine protein kinase [Medicago truncatula]|uniref:Putative non-specific serine/threonine protein kinase n=1 Tax=Medicago truncatula TaxID=3880 RepID=A0A396JR02_MEDTR|nr:putative non-specific serine/threonine protein kinase [Medicago truncatula]
MSTFLFFLKQYYSLIMISFRIKKQIILIYLWLWWSTTTSLYVNATNDSLKPGDTFNSNSTLCSKQGKYCLELRRYLIVIDVNGTVVWFYDRNHPFDSEEDSTVLSLDYSGVLKIECQDRKPMIIYTSPQPNNNTVATMLDTGNFLLQQLYPNGTKSILWQSFDYPTNFLIPTMKLGVNRKTGHNWSLVSWLTPLLQTSGEFSLEWEPKQGELNIKKRGKVYWKSGKLKSNGMFENIPVNVQHMYQYIIVSNKNEDSFAFEVKDGKFI